MLPHSTSWRSILKLSFHLRVGLPNGLFPSGLLTKSLQALLLLPIRATCPAYLILLALIPRIMSEEEKRSLSSSLCSPLHSTVTSSLLGPNRFVVSQRSLTPSDDAGTWRVFYINCIHLNVTFKLITKKSNVYKTKQIVKSEIAVW